MKYLQRFVGDLKQVQDISPIKHVDAVSVPVLLVHGKEDTVVSYDESRRFAEAMKKAGKTVSLVELKQEDHWLSREATRVQALEAIVAFVVKHNPPVMV